MFLRSQEHQCSRKRLLLLTRRCAERDGGRILQLTVNLTLLLVYAFHVSAINDYFCHIAVELA